MQTMQLLLEAGADVPKPLVHGSSVILMEYVGGEKTPAPTLNQVTIGHGEPAPMDPELEAHQLTQHLIVAMTAQLLEDAGLGPDIAQRIPLAFYSV